MVCHCSLQEIRADDIDTGPRGQVSYTLGEVRILSESATLTPSQIQGNLELRANGDVAYTGVAPEGLVFVVVINATDDGEVKM